MRDAVWAASPEYQWDASSYKGSYAFAYYRPSAADLWKAGATRSYELVAPHAEDALTRLFREGLKPLGVEWPSAFEVDSLEAIENLARRKGRVGLYVAVPGRAVPSGFRALPLPRFPAARIGVCWRAGSHPSVDVLGRGGRARARP